MDAVWVALGGTLGALARWGLGGWLERSLPGNQPWGTMAVNLLGCLALGLLDGLLPERPGGPASQVRTFLAVGFLGAFTTFSTFARDTIRLQEQGQGTAMKVYLLASVALGLLALLGGRTLGQALASHAHPSPASITETEPPRS